MKTFTYIFILSLLMSSCNTTTNPTVKAIDLQKEKDNVAVVLEKYVIANEKQDIEMIREIWATEPDIAVFGTNSNEQLIGWQAIESAFQRQFDTFEDTYISVHDQKININSTGNTAWFSEILNYNYIYQGDAVQFEGLRFTGVLSNINGDWLIVQSHISIPGTPQ